MPWGALLALQETTDDMVHTETVRERASRLSRVSLSLICGLIALAAAAVLSVSLYPPVEVTSLWVVGLMLLLAAVGLSVAGFVFARRSLREAAADAAGQDLRRARYLLDAIDEARWADAETDEEIRAELHRIQDAISYVGYQRGRIGAVRTSRALKA